MVKKEPITSFRGEYWIFSNLYEHPITFNNLIYKNPEACFQALKCSTEDEKLKFTLLGGAEAKRMGKTVKIDVKSWDEIKDYMMFAVVQAKFKQCEKFSRKLLETEGREIIEGNDHGDDYWGVCNKTKSGENKLGKILMTIRDRHLIKTTGEYNTHADIYVGSYTIPIDTVISRLKKGYYNYTPCTGDMNFKGIAELALNPRTSLPLTYVVVYEKDESGQVIGQTVVEGNDILTALVKLDSIAIEALYGNMMTEIRMTREGYEYFKSLNFKF